MQGAPVAVDETTRNAGRAKAARSQTSFYFSRDNVYNASDRRLGTRLVPALKPGGRNTDRTRLVVPSTTPTGRWYVLACADATRKVRESREGNNCRATSARISVLEPDATTPPTFPQTPNPLDVDSTLQTDQAASRSINPHVDDSLTATAVDGTTYTLEIPAGALLGPETITMTPVAGVSGLPLSGGLRAGVQIEPHGLMLQRPAQLTIDSPDAGPLSAQTAFLFHEGGADFHQYPVALPEPGDDANTIRLSLSHFSTPGVGSGTSADRSALAERVPSRNPAQAEAAISEILRQERANQQGGGEPNPAAMDAVGKVMDQYYDNVVKQQMQAAETNDDLAAEAIAAGLGWSRQMMLLGDESNPRHAEIMARVERILRNVMTAGWADCQDHDLSSIGKLLGVARQAALLGFAFQQEAQDKAFGCARFEVRLDSLVTSVGSFSGTLQSGQHNGRWHTKGAVTVPFLSMDASGPISFTEFAWSSSNTLHDADPDCTSTTVGTTTTPGTMRATAVPIVGLNVREGVPFPKPAVMASAIVPATSQPRETYQRTPCNGPVETSTDTRWASFLGVMRPDSAWTFDPTEQQADLIGTKTWLYSETRGGGTDTGETTMEVWHRPQV